MRIAASIISWVFQPLLLPTFGMIMVLLTSPIRFGHVTDKGKLFSVAMVFILTYIFPGLVLIILKLLGFISDIEMRERKQRIIPYVVITTFYLWTFMMFGPSNNGLYIDDPLVKDLLLGSVIGGFTCLVVNTFTKISVHSLAVGSMVGSVIGIAPFAEFNLTGLLIGSVVVAGLVGTSRLILKAHTPPQVFMGYTVGLCSMLIAFFVV